MTESDERPLLAGVMGWPVKHSRSPLLFGHWFAQHGIAGAYVRLAVREADFETVLRALPKAGFRGVNVTLPHKLPALALADEATQAARAIGAANTRADMAGGRCIEECTRWQDEPAENASPDSSAWRPSRYLRGRLVPIVLK